MSRIQTHILNKAYLLTLGLPVAAYVIGKTASPLNPVTVNTFTAHFLSIFIEAMPFLLLGTLVSGLVEAFGHPEFLARLIPRTSFTRAITGALLGFVFPVCECGVVPVVRRLMHKGVPMSVCISFLIAAPIMNPVVVWSTYSAFGLGPVFYGRFIVASFTAICIGLLASRDEEATMHTTTHKHTYHSTKKHPNKVMRALSIGADETIEMGFYLIIGCLIASALQTAVPQSTLTGIGGGAVASVIVMQLLAFIMSICSTVDAFVALGFARSFSAGSLIAFLTFGPMIDIKSTMMFLSAFKKRTVVALMILPFILTFAAGVTFNLFMQ